MFRYTKLSLLALAVLSGVAIAAKNMENDAIGKTIGKATISLAQAATAAEQHVNGRAVRAEFENSRQGWIYDVEVVSGAKVFDVRIDAEKGSVISSAEDAEDRDDQATNIATANAAQTIEAPIIA